jgi:hypothetical protein
MPVNMINKELCRSYECVLYNKKCISLKNYFIYALLFNFLFI